MYDIKNRIFVLNQIPCKKLLKPNVAHSSSVGHERLVSCELCQIKSKVKYKKRWTLCLDLPVTKLVKKTWRARPPL